jgi:predicted flap endonuclease-1-like 5' DNA nuclease/cell division protein FtsB
MFGQDITLGPGTGTFASHTLEILIMLLGAFFLGLWLGYILWNRYQKLAEQYRLDKESAQASLSQLNTEFGALKGRFTALETERNDLFTRFTTAEADNAQLQQRLQVMMGDLNETLNENLQLETELALQGNGTVAEPITTEESDHAKPIITTETDANSIELSVDASGATDMVQELEPTTDLLPEEEALAANELAAETDDDRAGILVTADPEPSAEYEEVDTSGDEFDLVMEDPNDGMAEEQASLRSLRMPDDHFSDASFQRLVAAPYEVEMPVISTEPAIELPSTPAPTLAESPAFVVPPMPLGALKQDDLKIVEGIGPKIEQLLFAAGINSYNQLAEAPVARLREILSEAGPRFAMHDPGTWSAQALLAANGEWENLKAYQDFLNAGKRPDK